MGESLILETSFLVDFERENNRGVPGPALAFLEAHGDARLYVTFTVAGELAAGLSLADRARWDEFIAPFHVLPSTAEVASEYGRAYPLPSGQPDAHRRQRPLDCRHGHCPSDAARHA